MKRNITIGVVIVLAFLTIGAREATIDKKLVEVGKHYLVSNGSAAMQGEILSDLGDGWYLMRRSQRGTGEVRVNVSGAFFIQELER